MNEERLREALREEPVPDEGGARERAWRLAQRAFDERPTRREPGRQRVRLLAFAVVFALAALVISPAGADVRHWIRDVVDPGREPSRPALTSLPAPGRLLVASAEGPWVVAGDGSKRLLGDYAEPAWSPHGKFVAVTTPHELLAVEPDGDVHWSIARGGPIRFPRWSQPDGYRIAYLDGDALRVIAGDGGGDRLLRARVASVAPAWRPGPRHELTYVAPDGAVTTMAADSGRTVFRTPAAALPTALQWSANGSRLLVTGRDGALLLDRKGQILMRVAPPPGARIERAALAPDSRRIALVTRRADPAAPSRLLVSHPGSALRPLFSGPGRFSDLTWSPDGRWLLLGWRDADQWLFLQPGRPRHIVAISNISAQFAPGQAGRTAFPSVAGWCCSP
jgi:WD40-like Beta Propeller Repeat